MSDLNLLIQTAIESVNSHPLYHLEVEFRKRIWMMLGENTSKVSSINIGRDKQYLLAAKTVFFVYPLWNNVFPNSDFVRDILDASKTVSSNQVELDLIVDFHSKAWLIIEEMFTTDEYQNDYHQKAISVAMSAWKTLGIILFDEILSSYKTGEVDADSDMLGKDVAYWAATAYAGPIWDEKNSDKNKRLAFWKWWLEEAIPQTVLEK